MAKQSKKRSKKSAGRSKKSKQPAKQPEQNVFWAQVIGFLTIVLAVLIIFGSFSTGGSLPNWLFDTCRKLVGLSAYFLPFILIYGAVIKLRSEDIRLKRSMFIGLVVLILTMAGLFHLFTDSTQSLSIAERGDGGGLLGHYITSVLLGLLNHVTAGLILVTAIVISVHYILKLPLTSLLILLRIDRAKPESDSPKKAVKTEAKSDKFKLNEGVPVQRSTGISNLKKVAKKAAKEEDAALTSDGDPEWNFPSLDLLSDKQEKADAGDVEGNAKIIEDTLSDFNIKVEMQGANIGPRVTQYTLKPESGIRLTKITALENNLALNLAATSIRMEAPIPGKRAVGIEVPNEKSASVLLKSILESKEWASHKSPLTFAIGKDIAGQSIVADLDGMPHLLIAGATGSGKSVMINSFLLSLLYRNSPSDLKLILVDPKQVELTPYNDIPHLLTPVVTQPDKAISALKWAVNEMEKRYDAMAEAGKRNIFEYNRVKKLPRMPYIVVVIDELADLMMLAARDVEALIVRLAQKSRAVGIHLVLATQRPSVDVITGLIKANVPARIAFTVTSQVDSRTIIDGAGAEKLLGKGDMLFVTPHLTKAKRIQGVLVTEKEISGVTDFVRMERAPEYNDEIITQPVQISGRNATAIGGSGHDEATLYKDAVTVVVESGKASASLLQRRLRVGYARAARLIEAMEEQGVVGPADGSRPRQVLVSSADEFGSDDEI